MQQKFLFGVSAAFFLDVSRQSKTEHGSEHEMKNAYLYHRASARRHFNTAIKMKKVFNAKTKAGLRKSNKPRLLGSIVEEMLHGSSPLAVGYRQYIASQENGEAEEQGCRVNTELGCNVKTFLRSDKRMLVHKEYPGILRLDAEADIDELHCRDAHMTFIEAVLSPSVGRRNVCIYKGKHISCTKSLYGMPRLNFKSLKQDVYSDIDNFATEVANEICEALAVLVEEDNPSKE